MKFDALVAMKAENTQAKRERREREKRTRRWICTEGQTLGKSFKKISYSCLVGAPGRKTLFFLSNQ